MKNNFAVIGNPIAHSLSPTIHQLFAKQTGLVFGYEKILVSQGKFELTVSDFFAQGGKGLNITSPFKQRAFAMAQTCTPRCQQAKAANTLWLSKGVLHADTTDGVGLIKDLSRYLTLEGRQVLLLGAGGGARSIIPSLLAANIAELMVVNRTELRAQELQIDFPQINYSSIDKLHSRYDLIINASSATLTHKTFSLPNSLLKPSSYCYDLVYNTQRPTPLLQWAHQQGYAATDGLGMLVEQAAESFYIWHGVLPCTDNIILHLRNYKN